MEEVCDNGSIFSRLGDLIEFPSFWSLHRCPAKEHLFSCQLLQEAEAFPQVIRILVSREELHQQPIHASSVVSTFGVFVC